VGTPWRGRGQGVYLRYPFDDLINLLVLESWRHRCVLIGEDLGVVPPGIRQRLAARGVLGTRCCRSPATSASCRRHSGAAMQWPCPPPMTRHRWPVGCAGGPAPACTPG
jgi:4-alpha-glucanotransferase